MLLNWEETGCDCWNEKRRTITFNLVYCCVLLLDALTKSHSGVRLKVRLLCFELLRKKWNNQTRHYPQFSPLWCAYLVSGGTSVPRLPHPPLPTVTVPLLQQRNLSETPTSFISDQSSNLPSFASFQEFLPNAILKYTMCNTFTHWLSIAYQYIVSV